MTDGDEEEVEGAEAPARLPTTPRWLLHLGLSATCALGLYSRSSMLEEHSALSAAVWALIGLSLGWGARLLGHLWWRSGRTLPSRWWSWVATSAVLLFAPFLSGLWSGMDDAIPFLTLVGATFVAASAALWLVRIGLARIDSRIAAPPRPQLGWYALAPLMVGATVLLMRSDVPRDVRFRASAPALRDAATKILSQPAVLDPATGLPRAERVAGRRWIGLYSINGTCRRGRNVYFTIELRDQNVGVVYAPRSDQLDDSVFIGEPSCVGMIVEFDHITGRWYAWYYDD